MHYSEKGKKTYGIGCEFDDCGWDVCCDVHHVNYQEIEVLENAYQDAMHLKLFEKMDHLTHLAFEKGFGTFDLRGNLKKDDRVQNLMVVCPNHHRYIHHYDLGLLALKHVKKRIRE